MKALWYTFEIMINIFQATITLYFNYAYLKHKNAKKFFSIEGLVFILLFSLTISVMNMYMTYEGLYAFVYSLILFIYSVMFLQGSILKKAFSAVYPIMVILISTSLVSNFMVLLMDSTQSEMLGSISVDKAIVNIIIQFFIFYLITISLKVLNNDVDTLSKGEWIMIVAILLISIAISSLLNRIAINELSYNENIYVSLIFGGIVIINIITFYCLIGFGKKHKIMHENEILKLQKEYNKSFVESAEREYKMIKELRHDSKDNYQIIYDYIDSGQTEKAKRYIRKINGDFSAKEIFIDTENYTFNAIVNSNFTVAKSQGIECTCIASSDFKGIDEYDLVRLLSNMIENAVTASTKSKSPKIELSIKEENLKYTFLLKNSVDTSILSVNPKLVTTKRDTKKHGLGIGIIKNIASKYNGRCDYYEENGFFCCLVILNCS